MKKKFRWFRNLTVSGRLLFVAFLFGCVVVFSIVIGSYIYKENFVNDNQNTEAVFCKICGKKLSCDEKEHYYLEVGKCMAEGEIDTTDVYTSLQICEECAKAIEAKMIIDPSSFLLKGKTRERK
jgi:hypothetical protein